MSKPSVFIIFLTVFIDLIGFGIVLPLIPIFSRDFGASELLGGVIMASFSAMQFFCAPFWGRLSDRIGRRPVILIGLAGSTLSYAVFAVASGLQGEATEYALWVILGSRILAGFMGANISVAQAYMADITPPEKRSKSMGLIGMAFGLGFILGPFIGGQSLSWIGLSGPGWVATGICGFAFLFALAKLKESKGERATKAEQRPHLQQIAHVFGLPQVGLLIMLFFLATFCFTTFETTLGWLVQDNFNLDTRQAADARTVSYLFAFAGFVGAMVQGGAIGRLVKMLGEKKLIVISLVLTGASLGPLPYAKEWMPFLAVLGGLAVGSSLARAPIFGMISIMAPANEQGATIGVAQSAGSLARILGPIFAGACFQYRPELPYLICGGISILAAFIALVKLKDVKHETAAPVAEPAVADS
jgi:MFS transporter, DHA1 family, tetracycline resistance protein